MSDAFIPGRRIRLMTVRMEIDDRDNLVRIDAEVYTSGKTRTVHQMFTRDAFQSQFDQAWGYMGELIKKFKP